MEDSPRLVVAYRLPVECPVVPLPISPASSSTTLRALLGQQERRRHAGDAAADHQHVAVTSPSSIA